MRYCVLGPLEVFGRHGEPLALGSPRQRAVLAVLLTEANRVVAVDRLLELLWRGQPPGQANATLQTYISGLRRVLEPERPPRARPAMLVTRAPGYSIVVGEGALDATEFEELAAAGHAAVADDPRRAATLFGRALALWRGEAYADFADEAWALPERNRLEELRLACVEDCFDAQLALGDHAAIVSELAHHVDLHPLRERARGQLMLALYRSGRQVEALRTFDDIRTRLVENLGLEPGPELRRLDRAILEHDAELDGPVPLPSARPPAPRPPPADTGSWEPLFVGRQRELAEVRHAIASTARGTGAVIVIEGETGTGKSRLLKEIASEVGDAGGVVLSGRGLEGESGPPLWPWHILVRDALAQLPGSADGPPADDPLATWAGRPGGGAAANTVSPAVARGRLFEAVEGLLAEVTASRWPVLLALDDLHSCGDDTLELLAAVARADDHSRLVIAVALASPGPVVRPALGAAMAALAAAPRSTRFTLGSFDRDEIAACIEATTGSVVDAAVVERIQERTGGNPFFTVEVGRLLATGVHDVDAVPESVRDVVRHRLARLPVATLRLLEAAALAGCRFELLIVAGAVGRSVADAAAHLEPAEAAGVVVSDDDLGRYRFSHGVVAEVVAAGLGRLAQARLHDALASALAQQWGDAPERAAEIAEHARAALPVGSPRRALEWLTAAARAATAALALGEAEEYHRRRIEVVGHLESGPEAWRSELGARADLAVLLTWRRGQSGEEVGSQLTRAAELAHRLGDVTAHAHAAWGLWTHHSVRAELPRAAVIAELLRSLGRESGDPVNEAIGDVATGATAYQQGRHVDARAALDRARDALGVVGARDLADVLLQHPAVHRAVFDAMVTWLLGDEAAGEAAMCAAVEAASALGHPYTEQFARSFATLQAALRDDVDGALELAGPLLATTRDQGFAYTATIAAAILGWARARIGDADGIVQMREAIAQRQAMEANVGCAVIMALLADALVAHGRLEEALDACDEGLRASDASTERYWDPELHRQRAITLDALGRGDEARAARQAAVDIAAAQHTPTLLRRAERDQARASWR